MYVSDFSNYTSVTMIFFQYLKYDALLIEKITFLSSINRINWIYKDLSAVCILSAWTMIIESPTYGYILEFKFMCYFFIFALLCY